MGLYQKQQKSDVDLQGAVMIDGTAITKTAAQLNAVATGVKATHIADITDSATGEQIAAAVNSILDALEAFGIVASS